MDPNQTATGRLATRRRFILNSLPMQLFGPLRRILQRWAQMRFERRTVEELSELDDRELADIGLSRRDIRSTVSGRLEPAIDSTRETLRDQRELAPKTRAPQPCGSAS